MLYTELTKRAMQICFDAHKDQKDKGGLPYVFHPFHVAEQMDMEEKICAALLHDVVEDTPRSFENLEAEGFPPAVIEALRLLTHEKGTDYMDYVRRLKDHPIASAVKLADLRHNCTPGRLPAAQGEEAKEQADRLRKYLNAQAILTGGEADLESMCLCIRVPDPDEPGKMRTLLLQPDGSPVHDA